MRTTVVILFFISALLAHSAPAETVEITAVKLLDRGVTSYRAGQFENAASDLKASTQAFLSQENMENYVNSGTFANLDKLETALVYLTLAQSKLGRTDDARETVLRLLSAERIAATYARLALPAEAAEFEVIAVRLVPESSIPQNFRLAGKTPPPDVPKPVQVAEVPQPAPVVTPPPVQVVQVPAPPATNANDRERYIEQRLAEERAKLERAFTERITAERASIQRLADERIAADQAADERLAALQTQMRRPYLVSLQNADELAAHDRSNEANAIYKQIVNAEDALREVRLEAAVGLYRTGAFRDAVTAFRKLANFGRGEEDLRYYHAVALYETGQYEEAHHELSCALPFIHVTEDVTRYQTKIERTASRQALQSR